jgi:hypothetical protein
VTEAAWALTVVWLLSTIAGNIPRFQSFVRRLDVLGVVPAWTFFAPNPGVTDTVILVRDLLEDDTWSPWVVAWRERPTRGRVCWRPDKRVAKLVADCGSAIPRAHVEGDETLGASFLLVANIAQNAPHDWRTKGFQFAIIDIPGWWQGNRAAMSMYSSPTISLTQSKAVP